MADADPGGVRAFIAGCPWCGPGTPLSVVGNGLGGVALTCHSCGARGPDVAIDGDFAQADERAITRWSERSAIDAAIIERLDSAVNLALLMSSGSLSAKTEVTVRYADLRAVVRIGKPDWQVR